MKSFMKKMSILTQRNKTGCIYIINPIFGDGGAAVMLEPTTEDFGIMDAVLRTDGKGLPFLHIKAGGSICTTSYYTLDNQMHYICLLYTSQESPDYFSLHAELALPIYSL